MMDQLLTVLGEDPALARRLERVRNRLKKPVVAGSRVAETEPGLFTLAAESVPSPG